MSKLRFFQNIFLLVMLVSASGCGNSPNVEVSEISRDTISYDETIHINNCGGKADSEQTASRSFATTIEGGAEISAGYQSIVEGSVSAKYSQYRNISKSQKLIAPSATNMEFVLKWSEDVHAGNITVNGSTGSYEVRVPVSVEQVSSQDLGCGTTQNQTCPYTSDNDETTIARIIQAEAEAVNKEDISIIRNIFDPNATIRFQVDGTEWHDPVAHYLENFDNADAINAVHFNIQPAEQGITSNTAQFISGSSGTIIFTDGERLDYYNELGKDTWVLKKNSSGCWVIVEFTFY